MAPKRDATSNPVSMFLNPTFTAAPAANGVGNDGSSDTQFNGPMTCQKTKLLANLYEQTAPVPKTTPVFGNVLANDSTMPSGSSEVNKSTACMIVKILAQLSISQDSSHKPTSVEDYDGSSSSSASQSPRGTPQSKSASSLEPNNSGTVIMPVMMTNASSLEEQVANMSKMINLAIAMKERDLQMASLMGRFDNIGESSTAGAMRVQERHQHNIHNANDGVPIAEPLLKPLQVLNDGSIPKYQVEEFVLETFKHKIEGNSRSTPIYTKPYTRRIDLLKMPPNYPPPKFLQFDNKGNPHQCIAYFVETCNEAGTNGDLMVKQFVHSLKGNASDWYTDLPPGTIDS